MSEDRQALGQLLDAIRAAPEPSGLTQRWRHGRLLAKGERALDWLDARLEGRSSFIWRHSRIPLGAMVMYSITIVPAVLLDPLMPSRGAQLLIYGAASLLLGWLGGHAVWDANERNLTTFLRRARSLPPSGEPRDPNGTTSPPSVPAATEQRLKLAARVDCSLSAIR